MEKDTVAFGPHLTLDLRGCDRTAITDLNVVFDFLQELPNRLGMTIIDPPKTMRYSGLVPEDWGVTGSVTIAESHCFFHSFPDRDGYVFIDVFSCKPFDVKKAVSYIMDVFSPTKVVRVNVVERGLDFPR